MKKYLRWSMLGLLLLAMMAVVVACGDDDDDDDTSENSGGESQVSNPPGNADDDGGADDTQDEDPRAGWPETFRLGLFGGDDAEETLINNEPLRTYLEDELGVEVELFTGTSYNAVIEAMRADRVDAMSVGPFSYTLAVQEADAEAVAVGISSRAEEPVYDPSIPPSYNSVIFTKKGNGVESLEDIRGKGFNFVDPASTSGHLAPKTLLIQRGFDPDNDFTTVFAGSHPTSAISVWNDKAEAGATNEGNLSRLDGEGQIDWCEYPDGEINKPRTQEEIDELFESCEDGQIVVLAQTDPIPNTPFAVRTELPDSFKTAVQDALLSIKDNPALIAETSRWYIDPREEGFDVETIDAFYNPLRDIAQLLDLDLAELGS